MDEITIRILALILLLIGIATLIASIIPIRQLIINLPSGKTRSKWYLLLGLTVLFTLGYTAYGIFYLRLVGSLPDLIVPSVFFLGATFVWLISSLSLQTAIDVRRVSLLEKENITDPLTGIYNRRYMERRLEEEFHRARQNSAPLSILLIDIDHFKNINDTHGHMAGDVVLSYLARLILEFIRGSDILARFGGDEFVIIAFNTPASQANTLANKIINHVERHELTISSAENEKMDIKTTVSIGVAGLTDEVRDITHLFSHADESLYCAKKAGRNRAAVHPCL